MLELISQLLQREGYDVQTVDSADGALDLLETMVPDLFIIDVVLPRLDGLALCRRLRRDPRTKVQPIIFITGQDSPYDVTDALAAGGDDFVLKPFAVRELMARLRANLRRVSQQETEAGLPHLRFLDDDRSVLLDGELVDLPRLSMTC